MVQQIVIEAETPGNSRTMFRLRIDASVIAEELTAVQAHILLGEILERVALPKASERAPSVTEFRRLYAIVGVLALAGAVAGAGNDRCSVLAGAGTRSGRSDARQPDGGRP